MDNSDAKKKEEEPKLSFWQLLDAPLTPIDKAIIAGRKSVGKLAEEQLLVRRETTLEDIAEDIRDGIFLDIVDLNSRGRKDDSTEEAPCKPSVFVGYRTTF